MCLPKENTIENAEGTEDRQDPQRFQSRKTENTKQKLSLKNIYELHILCFRVFIIQSAEDTDVADTLKIEFAAQLRAKSFLLSLLFLRLKIKNPLLTPRVRNCGKYFT